MTSFQSLSHDTIFYLYIYPQQLHVWYILNIVASFQFKDTHSSLISMPILNDTKCIIDNGIDQDIPLHLTPPDTN